jgi:hypothetical protein
MDEREALSRMQPSKFRRKGDSVLGDTVENFGGKKFCFLIATIDSSG